MFYKKSIKFQIVTALAVQLIVLLVVVSITLYLLNLRRHDYVILNLAGQLRVISQVMVNQSHNYLQQAPRDYTSYERDLGLYRRDLLEQIASYDTIIKAFQARNLSPQLVSYANLDTGGRPQLARIPSLLAEDDVIHCTWDAQSRSQLDATADTWFRFRRGLMQELADLDEPRLEAAAQYIQQQAEPFVQASTDLTLAFRLMMEYKLNDIRMLNQISLVISLLLAGSILLIIYRKVLRPIDTTVKGFSRVAQGDLAYQVPVADQNEIGRLTTTFNQLTQRLSAMFKLTDRITQATNLDDTLKFIFEEFRGFIPMDWVGMLRVSSVTDSFYIDRLYSDQVTHIRERDNFDFAQSLAQAVLRSNKPVSMQNLASDNTFGQDALLQRFVAAGIHSVIYLPLSLSGSEQVILVLAARTADAYDQEHLELLENIAGQVSHGFEKTIGMESLVVSAVEGLAKLAESRDPETGDHLYRMSRYSVILAEQMARDGHYAELITPAYVRDILRFAPMHDIGKVGIADSILLKPGKLTEQERSIMQQHPVIGAQVLQRCEQQVNAVGHSIFRIGIEIAASHHEKYNGQGYPYGLTGENIPLSARIVAVADVFDALTSRRPYKQAWPIEQAMQVMQAEAGEHFDPKVVSALERAMAEILKIYDRYKHV